MQAARNAFVLAILGLGLGSAMADIPKVGSSSSLRQLQPGTKAKATSPAPAPTTTTTTPPPIQPSSGSPSFPSAPFNPVQIRF